MLLFNSVSSILQRKNKTGEEGGDENWRKGDCVISKGRDLKTIEQFETLGVFLLQLFSFFLTDAQGSIYRVRNILPV